MVENNIINILGINISTLNKSQVLEKIGQFLEDDPATQAGGAGKQHQIVTPNPEFILNARKDEEFFYILNNADLAIPDGVGLKFASWTMGKNLHKYAGADLVKDILRIAQNKNLKVGIINWNKGLSGRQDIENALKNKYAKLKFTTINIDKNIQNSKFKIQNLSCDILFCALGAPHQEKFIYHNLKNTPSVKIAIGVGGSFDFLTGKIKRAPKFLRIMGLEWLWRLIKQPWRAKRIYHAVIKFPLVFLKWKFILPLMYRPNVACILFKKHNDKYKILLVERSDDENHWQLPQGGIDGEKIELAGGRELEEELGGIKFKRLAVYKNIWKYKFDDRSGKYNYTNRGKKILGHKGQKQSLFIAEFLGSDKDIKINFWDHRDWKWVDAENLVDEAHPVRREANKIFLEKFRHISRNT